MSQQIDWLETESDESTSSLADFPVKKFPLPVLEPVCPVSAAASGPSFSELSLKFDPLGQSLKMSLGLELSELTGCSLTWQEQVTPLGRWWWVLSMLELRTDGSGFGLLPTPRTTGLDGGSNSRNAAKARGAYPQDWMLPTPTATPYGRNKGGQNPEGPERLSLESMAKAGQLTHSAKNTQSVTTRTNAKTLTDAGSPNTRNKLLPTPTATDAQGRGYQYSPGDKKKPALTLPGAVGAASSPQNGTGQGRLSPCFVEWLMGYPVGWTDVSESRDSETR